MSEPETLKVRAEFPLWLRRQRDKLGWSQRELAKNANLAHNMISNLESRGYLLKHQPTAETCKQLANALNADPDLVLFLANHRDIDPRRGVKTHPELQRLQRRLLRLEQIDNEDDLERALKAAHAFLDALLGSLD